MCVRVFFCFIVSAAKVYYTMAHIETEYYHEKVLFKCRDKFYLDFEYVDVAKKLENARIFQPSDINAIRHSIDRKEQIDKLFFYLVIRGKQAFELFLHQIKDTFEWLVEAVENELRHEQQLINSNSNPYDYRLTIIRLHKELAKFVDFNVHRCDLVSINLNVLVKFIA